VEENNKIKKAQFTKDEFTSAQSKKNKKPTFNIELDPIVSEAAKEVQQGASHAKAVARWGPPGCRRNLGGGKPAPPFSGGCMPPCIGWFHLLRYLDPPNRPSWAINRWLPLICKTHIIGVYISSHLSLVSLVLD